MAKDQLEEQNNPMQLLQTKKRRETSWSLYEAVADRKTSLSLI